MRRVRALREGEAFALVVYDAAEVWNGDADGSLRLLVSRNMGNEAATFEAEFQVYGSVEWARYYADVNAEAAAFFCLFGPLAIEEVGDIVPFFAYLGRYARRIDEKQFQTIQEEAEARERRRARERAATEGARA